MSNSFKYIALLILTFACGALAVLFDGHGTVVEILKHGALFSLPTILALRTKLEDSLGVKPQDPPSIPNNVAGKAGGA